LKTSYQTMLELYEESTTNQPITYNKIHVSKSTFLGGQSSPVHRWFRLTPSYGPELVDVMLSRMDTRETHCVLDPFAGAGTTLYQCKFNGLSSYGFEINPFLYFVCKTSINLNLSPPKIKSALVEIEHLYHERLQQFANTHVEDIGVPIPPIHNVYRWWRPDVLKELLILKSTIADVSPEESYRDFFYLGLAGVLVPDLTNVTLGRLQLHFVDKSKYEIHVWETFLTHIKKMIHDLETLDDVAFTTPATIFNTDSTTLEGVTFPEKIDRVVTSPPYPNRYSYVWNTRPFLYFFDFISTGKEASELDQRTIGGTWGTATSVLAKGVIEPAYPVIAKTVSPVVEEIRSKDNLMANYVMKYFNLLAQQIVSQDRLLSEKARCAYVVGCSRIKGVYVETDRLLGDIFEGLGLGYRIESIERFRNRHSGENLHESIVYVYKE
jgi:hypothetical protein